MKRIHGRDKLWAQRIKEYEVYLDIGVAYDWSFEITETDNADGNLDFNLPYFHPGSFDLKSSALLHKTRLAKRTFKNGGKFAALLTKDYYDFCTGVPSQVATGSIPGGPIPHDKNFLYPITGSVGLRKVVDTLLAVASQEGGDGSFVDELTFTTQVSGTINPSINIAPVTNAFRLVNASSTLLASRLDVHLVKISLVFPKSGSAAAEAAPAAVASAEAAPTAKTVPAKGAKKQPSANGEAPDATADKEGSADKKVEVKVNVVNAGDAADIEQRVLRDGYRLNTLWRARYNLCVQDGRSREDDLKILRFTAPEVYCIESTDTFVPRDAGVRTYGLRPVRRPT